MSNYVSVTAVNKYIKNLLDTDNNLHTVMMKGEISNFKPHASGHMYFSLKDEKAKINAIMFAGQASNLKFKLVDGMKVLVTGRISSYEAMGSYQIIVNEMQEDGIGNLYIEFEKLKKQLQAEGLFDEKTKKTIPKYPTKIGIITADSGAAIKDILSTIKRRYNIAQTILFPSLVQGIYAKEDIVKNIKLANTYDLDVLIIGRGGGSIEDLWAFNEEIVARAIKNSKIPTISAVGHEVDYTIADFVADLRAPTPTAAAELAAPNITDIINHISQLKIRTNENIHKKYNLNNLKLESLKNSYMLKNPMILYENKRQTLDVISQTLNLNIKNKLEKQQLKLTNYIEKIEILNPLSTLKRGYSITYKNNKITKSIKNIKPQEKIKIKLKDGFITAQVMEVKSEI